MIIPLPAFFSCSKDSDDMPPIFWRLISLFLLSGGGDNDAAGAHHP
ncbi:hypothetical protein JHU04_002326 [Brenneria sp. 4F2]|nr:hypothetical protein [Brenneria bubanii]